MLCLLLWHALEQAVLSVSLVRPEASTLVCIADATTVVTCMAFLSYYAMSTGYGWTTVSVGDSDMARQFFYARYIDWAVTTPLLLVRVGAGKQFASEPFRMSTGYAVGFCRGVTCSATEPG